MNMGYVMQMYDESREYHLYQAYYDENGTPIKIDDTPLCGDGAVTYDSRRKLAFKNVKTEDEMARACAEQKTSVRHQICAKCVGRFYKTY